MLDFEISDDILQIVNEEVTRIKLSTDRTDRDMLTLEKATKIFSMLQANTREAVKAGMFADLKDSELEQSHGLESAVDSAESDDNL